MAADNFGSDVRMHTPLRADLRAERPDDLGLHLHAEDSGGDGALGDRS